MYLPPCFFFFFFIHSPVQQRWTQEMGRGTGIGPGLLISTPCSFYNSMSSESMFWEVEVEGKKTMSRGFWNTWFSCGLLLSREPQVLPSTCLSRCILQAVCLSQWVCQPTWASSPASVSPLEADGAWIAALPDPAVFIMTSSIQRKIAKYNNWFSFLVPLIFF